MLQTLLQNVFNGLQWGSFYSMIALGYCLVYGVLRLINFAHGDIFMMALLFRLLHRYGPVGLGDPPAGHRCVLPHSRGHHGD